MYVDTVCVLGSDSGAGILNKITITFRIPVKKNETVYVFEFSF